MRMDEDAIRTALGILTLERAPKNVLFSEDALPGLYDQALQEYTDILAEAKVTFEGTAKLKQQVLDDIRRYLDKRRMVH